MKLLTLTLLTVSATLAQQPPSLYPHIPAGAQLRTLGMGNGRMWAGFQTLDTKVIYLTGVKDAILSVNPPNQERYFAPQFSMGEVAKAVDQFYAVPENTLIPIVDAVQVCVAKFKGATQAQIESLLSDLRRLSAQ